MREISLDTETTGLDPHSGHRIVEIGCVELINHVKTSNHFHIYLNPQRDMPREAENVHGLSAEFLSDKPLFKSIADAFLEFIGDDPLVIHNASFDMKFINAELDRIGKNIISMDRTIDTVVMARKKFPGAKANLDALCQRFGIDLSARTKHGALLDAELLADVYLELKGGRQTGLSLDADNVSDNTQQDSVALNANMQTKAARTFAITDQERSAHEVFIKNLNDPIWKKLENA